MAKLSEIMQKALYGEIIEPVEEAKLEIPPKRISKKKIKTEEAETKIETEKIEPAVHKVGSFPKSINEASVETTAAQNVDGSQQSPPQS